MRIFHFSFLLNVIFGKPPILNEALLFARKLLFSDKTFFKIYFLIWFRNMVHTSLNIRTLLQKKRYGGYAFEPKWISVVNYQVLLMLHSTNHLEASKKSNFACFCGVTERRFFTECFHGCFEFTQTSLSVSINSVEFQTNCFYIM